MARQVFRFDLPDRFVAGTVGEPGQRTFYLQARDVDRLVSVALEKEQVSVLAERLDALLDEVVRRTDGTADVPAATPSEVDDLEPLEQPIVEEFRVGVLRLGWEGEGERVVVEAFAVREGLDEEADDSDVSDVSDEDDEDDGRDVLTVRLSGEAARAFVVRARAVVSAGRPACPLCAQPLDPGGHVCPRQNGFRRRG
ncbi:MAG TPA: DUF3090 family protein [Jiangellales bacterium]|nr:DUF3090 family protein [Jiangellales bacterium]